MTERIARYGPAPKLLRDRLMQGVVVSDKGCWEWQGTTNPNGYGMIRVGSMADGTRRFVLAHRVAFQEFKGFLPPELHHQCVNTLCINPDHLEPVSHKENLYRSEITITVLHAAKTHCPQGHPYDHLNTAMNNGSRVCRTCARERGRLRNDEHRRVPWTPRPTRRIS